MDVVKLMVVCALAILPCHKASSDTPSWRPFVTEASVRFGVPQSWIMAVIQAESNGQTLLGGVPITSSAGAMGLMQVMPQTYNEMRVRYGLGTDPYDPRNNILAGTAYLAEMYRRYNYPWCFAAYNAGPQRLDSYLEAGVRLPAETLSYLATIEVNLQSEPIERLAKESIRIPSRSHFYDPKAASSPLFFVLGETNSGPFATQNPSIRQQKISSQTASQELFVPLGSPLSKSNSEPSTEP